MRKVEVVKKVSFVCPIPTVSRVLGVVLVLFQNAILPIPVYLGSFRI